MALIKINELKQMDEKTLENKIEELRKELIKVNAKVAIGTSVENPGKIREIKKTIARILTISKEKTKEKDVKKEAEKSQKTKKIGGKRKG